MSRVFAVLRNPRVRLTLVVLIVGLTFTAFTYYLATHPDVLPLIFSLPPAALVLLVVAYIGTILANAFVLSVSLRLIGKSVSFKENVNLTGYSSVVNFFGPLQSGPGFRAAYLKQKHGVGLTKFFYATLVFYGFFAFINAAVVVFALLLRAPGGYTAPIIIVSVVTAGVITWSSYQFLPRVRTALRIVKLTDLNFWLIGLGALALSLCTAAAYFVELLHVDPTINFVQTAIYTAAANLALFVSLTPGAIGFRESFLLLTERLHQIPADVVLAASIIDRAFYVVFLLAMFLLLLGFGARAKLLANKRP